MELPKPHELLKLYVSERQANSSAHSLRALAKRMKLSPSYLSQIFNGKRKLSAKTLNQFVEQLNLDSLAQERLFQALIYYSLPSNEARLVYKNNLKKNQKSRSTVVHFESCLSSQYDILTSWYNLAVLDLTLCDDFQSDISWIAKRLGISEYAVSHTVGVLFFHGLLVKSGETWKKAKMNISFPTVKSDKRVRIFHRQMISKSLEELNKSDLQAFRNRLITGLTVASNSKNIERAKIFLDQALDEVFAILAEPPCTELYQVNLQLFPLTKST